MVVPQVDQLFGGEPSSEVEEARRASPEAAGVREESEASYVGLGPEAAESVDNQADPGLVEQPSGGPPATLPEGDRIVSFPTDYAMSVAGAESSREVREGLEPVAFEMVPGKRTPLDLGLSELGGAFQPKVGLAPVRIPKRLSEGAALSEAGVSLTPVDEHGVALGGEGVIDGASVFYGDSEDANAGLLDVDTLVKPSTFGLMMDTSLRSQRSPSKLFFKVGLPKEATLEQEAAGSGPVRVVEGDRKLAVIFAPSARDAEGTSVPVSMVLEEDMLVLTVNHPAGAYAYPIMVDPRYEYYADEFTWDKQINGSGSHPTNWHFEHPEGPLLTASENSGGNGWTVHIPSNHGEHEQGGMVYTTQGLSHIWDFASETSESDEGAHVETRVQTYGKGGVEAVETTPAKASLGWNIAVGCQMTSKECKITPETKNSAAYLALTTGAATGIAGENVFHSAEVAIQQEVNPEVAFDTTDETVDGRPNALYGTKTWLGPHSNALVKFTASDKGIGVEGWSSEHTNTGGGWESLSGKSMLSGGLCSGIQCPSEEVEYIGYSSALPDGEPKLGLDAWNAMYDSHAKENEAESLRRHVVKVDSTPPHSITVAGLGSGNEIGEGAYNLGVEATDGEGTTPSSGVKSIAVSVDGREIGLANGSCSVPAGPCTAKGEWTVSGGEFGAGEHKLKVTATDNALNVATDEITLKVHHATPVSVGPGAVAPTSGEFSMSATDVSVGAPGSSLTVGRSYQSRRPTAGAEGPLGPQWSLSVGGQESITKLPTGSATLTASSGVQTAFTSKEGGGFSSPTGDANLTLSEGKNAKGELTEYVLQDAGDAETTRFTSLGGPSSSLWKPVKQEGPIASQAVRYIYQTAEGITEPKYAVAPEPSGLSVSCISALEKSELLEKLEKGCRVLEFQYGTSTKATGENESEWNEYKGRLKQVLFEAESPSSKKMEAPVAVAAYIYDKQGRLRAEWNPHLEHSLKVVYGYDTEGHVTAMTPPGQESWAFTYGTMAGDSNAGRLLKVMRAPASAKLWGGEAPKDAAVPTLSGTPVVGARMGVSTGTWSNEPVAYGYQWEDCNSEEEACTAILGANNANYTVTPSDVGHVLIAQVSATNGGGTTTASGTASTEVKTRITEFPVGEASVGVAEGSDGNLWLPQEEADTVSKVTPSGGVTTYKLPSPFCGPEHIAAGPSKESALWFTDVCGAAIGKITTSGSTTAYSVPSGSTLRAITAGPDGNMWYVAETSGKIGKITTSGTITEYALPKGSEPHGITAGPSKENALWFTDRGTSKIGKITTSGTITEYALPAGSEPAGITAGSDGNLWFAEEGSRKIGKMTTSGTKTEYAVSGGSPYEITSGSDGNLWFTIGSSKLGKITTSGTLSEYTLPAESQPAGITAGPNGALWFTETHTGKLAEISPVLESEESEALPAQPGTTIEYNVPVSGQGLPVSLTKTEVETWGQKKDDPTEGMAIFPPEKPQGWPASSYEGATIDYVDEKGRSVNTVLPSGGVSTAEYNAYNDVVRTLSPDNRATALKEPCESKENCKSAEVAELLDSESTYEEKGSEPGAELLSGLGPQHTVKLANGTQVEARSHTIYTYNEEEPSGGGPYHLVTKTSQGAQYAGKEEDTRTVTTSYSGQETLGWKLRKPTSTTTYQNGQKLTRTTTYEESTGNVKETTTPGATGEQIEFPVGEASVGVAEGSDGNLWLPQEEADTVSKVTPSGGVTTYKLPSPFCGPEHIAAGPSKESALWFTDVCGAAIGKITTSGSTTAYSVPSGSTLRAITAGPDGNMWYVAETSGKIGKITTSGTITEYALPKGSEPHGITAGPSKENALWFTDRGTSKIGKITTSGTITEYALPAGSEPAGITAGSDGNLWFAEEGSRKIGKMTTSGTKTEYAVSGGSPYEITSGSDGNLWFTIGSSKLGKITTSGTLSEYTLPAESQPAGITAGPNGALWFTETHTGKLAEISPNAPSGNPGADDTQTIYYTKAANPKYTACGEHPEWANLPCQTQPAEQPGTSGLPNLPTTTVMYNIWDEPEKTTQTVGAATRTTDITYDAAGRLLTSETTSTEGTALPKVTDKYSETTGQLLEQSTGTGSEAKKITYVDNTLGQLVKYTDADGNTTEYEYEPEKDERLVKVNDGKGTQAYTYEEPTGDLAKLVDTQGTNVLTFTAAYDIEGNMTSEGYPNGMTATYSRNTTGEATGLTYEKTTHCTEKCVWFTESLIPSIHGQTMEQVNSLAKTSDAYAEAGELTQVQETPTGEGCTTRIYAYEAETNRTSLTTYKPNSKNECATESGTEEKHSYDTANHLTDTGIKYNELGDITKLPAADADGTELQSTFYVDGQLNEQKQGGQTIGYNLDPAGRPGETVDTGTVTSTYISHYPGPGDSPSWTVEPVSGHWARYVSGISGFAAIETDTTEPELQLANLQGDIVGKASASETATKLLSTERPTEYGVPTTAKPAKYSWLGGDLLPTELPSGVIAMGARNYIPQIGRFLQPDPIPGGSTNAYAYTNGNPVNETDLTGDYVENNYSASIFSAEDNEAIEQEAAREAAARAVAEREAQIAAAVAALQAKEAAEQAAINAQDRWDEEAAAGPSRKPGEVLYEAEGCTGTNACAAGILGFSVSLNLGEIGQWWQQVKGGWKLIKEVFEPALEKALRKNSTVCKAVGYAGAVGSYFIPESRFAKLIGLAVGLGTTYSC